MAKPILYSYFRSSASWRVRIALEYKGIEYEYRPVNLLKNQQMGDDYKGTNPIGQVPALIIDGATFTQSLPIIEYLEETRPGKNLLPKDPIQRAHARRLAEIVNAGTQPLQNLPVLGKIKEWCGDEKRMEWGKYWIHRGLAGFEGTLLELCGKYSIGDNVTIADLCLVPQVANAITRFAVDMNEFPTISRINEELTKLDAFQAADPTKQPDCPEDLRN